MAESVSWLVFCSLVSVQSRQVFFSLQTPERAKHIDMSQEGDVENEMQFVYNFLKFPLGKKILICQLKRYGGWSGLGMEKSWDPVGMR